MNIIISSPNDGQYSISGLLRELYAYHGAYFNSKAIHTSYNDLYHFWDVTVNRGVLYKQGWGHGSIELQQRKWQEYIDIVLSLHKLNTNSTTTAWTWEPIVDGVYIENQRTCNNSVVFCPSIRFFLTVKK